MLASPGLYNSKVKGEGRGKGQLNRKEKFSVSSDLGPKKTNYTGTPEHSIEISDNGNMLCKWENNVLSFGDCRLLDYCIYSYYFNNML